MVFIAKPCALIEMSEFGKTWGFGLMVVSFAIFHVLSRFVDCAQLV